MVDVHKETNNQKRKSSRKLIWIIASIIFGGMAFAYGLYSDNNFYTGGGAVIAAIGAIRLGKRMR